MKFTDEFIKEIPKTDLHLHLDGSLRLESLIDMAKKDKIDMPSYTVEGMKEKVFKETYNDLGEYLHGFMYTCQVLRNLENIERASYELAIDNQKEGVFYIEPRFAPQLLMDNESLTLEAVLEAANNGLARAQREFNSKKEVVSGEVPPFHYGIIVCAMRMFGRSNFSPYYTNYFSTHQYSEPMEVICGAALELAKGIVKVRNEMEIPIVGFDIAGQEAGYPAGEFKDAYEYVHRHFIHKTVHAGEAYGAESIFQAITELSADRLGHGYYLFDEDKIQDSGIQDRKDYIKKLSSIIAEKRITIEVCLTSNLQTNPSLKNIKDHSLKHMLKDKMSCSICTDNRLISSTTVSKEVKLAIESFSIGAKELKSLMAYGFKRSFFPGDYSEKRHYAKTMMDYYDVVAKKHGVS